MYINNENELQFYCNEKIQYHYNFPFNYGKMNKYTKFLCEKNKCGDVIKIYFLLKNQFIKKIYFESEGCALSKVSTSLMLQKLNQRNIKDANQFCIKFLKKIKEVKLSNKITLQDYYNFGDVISLLASEINPIRINCILFPWIILQNELQHQIYML